MRLNLRRVIAQPKELIRIEKGVVKTVSSG